jgi:hypothetical protein
MTNTNRVSAPHVVSCDGRNPNFPFGVACLHCGAKQPFPTLPISVDDFVRWSMEFVDAHKDCPPPKTEDTTHA